METNYKVYNFKEYGNMNNVNPIYLLTEGKSYSYQFVYDVMYRINLFKLFSELVYEYNYKNPNCRFNNKEIDAMNKIALKLYNDYPNTINSKIKLLNDPVVVKVCNIANNIKEYRKEAAHDAKEDTEYFFSIVTGDRTKYDSLHNKNEFRKDMLTYNNMLKKMKW